MSWVKINTEFQLYYTHPITNIFNTLGILVLFCNPQPFWEVVFDYTADLIKLIINSGEGV